MVALDTLTKFYAKDRKAWREWLVKNHNSSKGIWLVYDKGTNRRLSYADMVEELLCFGWIDSLQRSLSETQSMQYVCPRKLKSPWSKLNKSRIQNLIDKKLMTRAGLEAIERAKKDGSWTLYDAIEKLTIPDDLKKEFQKNKKAQENFVAFSNSNKKQILWFIASAKQEGTRNKRIAKVVEAAEKGLKL